MSTPALAAVRDAYARASHTPRAQLVRESYTLLCRELWQQFERLPMRVTFADTDPYASSYGMHAACDAGVLQVFRYAELPPLHPFARRAPNGELWNSIFRAVHDGFAHYSGRHSFSVLGELAAFRVHWLSLAHTPRAQLALATETLGQTAIFAHTHRFAEQKATLLPLSVVLPFLKEA